MYNEQENLPLLHEAITKVIDPAAIDFELILVDDGSKDGSWAVIERLVAKDPRRARAEVRSQLRRDGRVAMRACARRAASTS